MKMTKTLCSALMIGLLAFGAVACDPDEPDNVDEVLDEAQDNVEDAADDLKDAAEDVGDEIKDAGEEIKQEVE